MRLQHFLFAVCLYALCSATGASPITFESGQVRPMAMSADGQRLYVVNTPDNTLEIFSIGGDGLEHMSSVAVGLEPIALAEAGNTEVWVVNHLSDSVSIVTFGNGPPRVTRTLLTGDEPRDIVFAGPGGNRAFISAAHRGQNSPYPDGEYDVPGSSRADVWVFESTDLGASLGGDPLTIIELFGDKPRALAVSQDGTTVYAAVFRSGNRTTTVNEGLVCDGGSGAACAIQGGTAPGGLPAPINNHESTSAPESGLIVQFDPASGLNGEWRDELDRDWSDAVRFSLPDMDVFAIDANAAMPVQTKSYSGVGTVLFNMVVNPVSGKLYVSNTDANNRVRFEGPGTLAATVKPVGEPATVRGHLHEARITIIEGATVSPRHLNKHIDYADIPVPPGIKERSLATPTAMSVSADGTTLYVAAFGSGKIGVFDTDELEDNIFIPDAADHILLTGGGPSGLVLNEGRDELYVLTRFDNTVSVVDLATGVETTRWPLHNPEPANVVNGRPFLYDANLTSSNGEASCAACHIYGDMDDLAWDLGNPDEDVVGNPNPFPVAGPASPQFHPMKGPMTTQSLRGISTHGPMHWRGDRTAGNDMPPGDPLDEEAAFKAFNGAFDDLLGRDEGPLSDTQMQAFADFALTLAYPPNPVRQLNNLLRTEEQRGRDAFFQVPGPDLIASCEGCHRLDPANGFFGADGGSSIEGEPQEFKVAHLRNLYQKVGMFGMAGVPFIIPGDNTNKGDQIRGFGFMHDGSTDTVFRFLLSTVFSAGFNTFFPDPVQSRLDLEAFMMAFDTDLAPIVGQQITLADTSPTSVDDRVDLLFERADAPFTSMMLGGTVTEADIIVKGVVNGDPRGWQRLANGNFKSDLVAEAPISEATLLALADVAGQELTFTAVIPGDGYRLGIDRDADGVLNGDDVCPAIADPNQLDNDSDGIGDLCDSDDDNDTLSDADEIANGLDPFDPDSDADGIGDALDLKLGNPHNFCTGSTYIFDELTVSGPLTCAAATSITVSPLPESLVEVLASGDLRLIAPIVNFESGFVVIGLLTVTSADPCPNCAP